jgi:hypothetical protein
LTPRYHARGIDEHHRVRRSLQQRRWRELDSLLNALIRRHESISIVRRHI